MIPSPLRLDNYFFTKIHMDACPKGCEKPGEGVTSSKVECLKHKDTPNKWMVQAEVRKADDKEKGCPEYTFHVQVVGLFEVAEAFPAEKAEKMVRTNAPSVLYGAIREMIANLTARGPFPAIKLPTVTFIDEALTIPKEHGRSGQT